MSYKGGNAVEIGECVFLPDQKNTVISTNSNTQTYLKSGNLVADQDATYPDAYAKFKTLSPNYSNWVNKTNVPDTSGSSQSISKIFFLNNNYFITTVVGGAVYQMYTAPTLDDVYTEVILPGNSVVNDMIYAYGLYIVVTNDGFLYTSPNLTTWTSRVISGFTGSAIIKIIYAGSFLIAVNRAATSAIARSTDGINWTVSTLGSAWTVDMCYHPVLDRVYILQSASNSTSVAAGIFLGNVSGISGAFSNGNIINANGGGNFSGFGFSLAYLSSIDRLVMQAGLTSTTYQTWTNTTQNGNTFKVSPNNPMTASFVGMRTMISANGLVFSFNSANQIGYTADGDNWTILPSLPTGFGIMRCMLYGKNEYIMTGSTSDTISKNKLVASPDSKYLGISNKVTDTDGLSVLYMRIK